MAEMLDRLSLTVVVDDAAGQDSALRAQHGLSVWMEGVAGEQTLRLLLDVGQSFDTLRHNMSLLGLAPGSLDALVLSHGHYDHTGGMASLVRATGKALLVVAHPDLFRPIVFLEPGPRSIGVRPEDQRPAVQAAGGVLLLSTDPVPLGPGMTTTGVVPRSS
ncbi:MAG TPA: MBL fold metallo-hydrolase, partial [Synergistaceae bacterium]|nr:MBL fold metallo-hydrolase [Synergistaceae bacterium]